MLFSAGAGYWRLLTKEVDETGSLDEKLNRAFSVSRGQVRLRTGQPQDEPMEFTPQFGLDQAACRNSSKLVMNRAATATASENAPPSARTSGISSR